MMEFRHYVMIVILGFIILLWYMTHSGNQYKIKCLEKWWNMSMNKCIIE